MEATRATAEKLRPLNRLPRNHGQKSELVLSMSAGRKRALAHSRTSPFFTSFMSRTNSAASTEPLTSSSATVNAASKSASDGNSSADAVPAADAASSTLRTCCQVAGNPRGARQIWVREHG